MNDPFAPPIHDRPPPPAPKPAHDPARGPWRCEGRVLARSHALWPARCVKCNSADALVHGVFVRHVPLWVYLIFPIGVIPFLILWKWNARLGVAAVFLCGRHRRTRALSRLSYPLAAVAVAVAAMAVGARMDSAAVGLVALAALLSVFVFPRETVWARAIEGDLLELEGTSEAFRASLPEWDDALLPTFRLESG